jgi:hypothetical protein
MNLMQSGDEEKYKRIAYLWNVVRIHFGPKNFISRLQTQQRLKNLDSQRGIQGDNLEKRFKSFNIESDFSLKNCWISYGSNTYVIWETLYVFFHTYFLFRKAIEYAYSNIFYIVGDAGTQLYIFGYYFMLLDICYNCIV